MLLINNIIFIDFSVAGFIFAEILKIDLFLTFQKLINNFF